jgi:S1-C subfamily serine protease
MQSIRRAHLTAAILLTVLGPATSSRADETVPAAQPAASAGQPAVATSSGQLKLSVVVVDELTPKPVPFTYFQVTNTADNTSQNVKTDAQGKIELSLAPGTYTVTNAKALEFKGHSYTWKSTVTIEAGKTAVVEWTDADAVTLAAKPARQISEEAGVYNMRKMGVVTVEGDRGSGSGFIVSRMGLVLTNQHVISGGPWAAIRFERGIRVPAVIVAQDRDSDVAVLCFNPAAYKDFTVVPLADPSQGPLAVEGEKVLAIGSPLNQEKILTTGIVSKVEKDYLISDVNINHGNSGGPLFNLAGDVIGINTFGDFTDQGGPGVSGIISIAKALSVLAKAREKVAAGIDFPSAERLPDISPVPIPAESLAAYTVKTAEPWSTGKPKNFETIIATPFYRAALQAEFDEYLTKDRADRVKKRGKQGVKPEKQNSPSRFWERYALHNSDPIVYIMVRPVLKTNSKSAWGSALSTALFGVRTKTKQEFRDDFYDMALYRGDTLVYPIRRGREAVSALYEDYDTYAKDVAYGGIYFYDSSAFAPGAELKLYVRRESDLDRWDVLTVDSKVQARIYAMYMPYRSAVAQVGGDLDIRGLSASVHTPPPAGAEWTSESQRAAVSLAASVTPLASEHATSRVVTPGSSDGNSAALEKPGDSDPVKPARDTPANDKALGQPATDDKPASGNSEPDKSATSANQELAKPAAGETAKPAKNESAKPVKDKPAASAKQEPAQSSSKEPEKPASAPTAPTPVAISDMPCRVRVSLKNGNSYIGKATQFDGSAYTLETRAGTMSVKAMDLSAVEYIKN